MSRRVVSKYVCRSRTVRGGVTTEKVVTTITYDDGSTEVSEEIRGGSSEDDSPSKMSLGSNSQLELAPAPESLTDSDVEHVRDTFHRFDADHSGYLDASEVRAMCTELIGREVSADAAMAVVMAMDKNADKKVQLSELLSFWPGIRAFLVGLSERGAMPNCDTPKPAIPHEDESTVSSADESVGPTEEAPCVERVPGSAASMLSNVEKEVFHEINLARTRPQDYADFIEEEMGFIKDGVLRKPGKIGIRLQEGVPAYKEAVEELRKMKPKPALKEVPRGLYMASRDHCRDQSQTGATGHSGSDGSSPSDRCSRYGSWQSSCGENISYGGATGRAIMIQLIVDDGVPSRGHRKNIYGNWTVVGVGCGPHPTYGWMCTQNFAGGYSDRATDNPAVAKAMEACASDPCRNPDEAPPRGQKMPLKGKGPSKPAAKKAAKAAAKPGAKAAPAKAGGAAKVKMYGRDSCGLCVMMGKVLDAHGVAYEKKDIDKDQSFFQAMMESGFSGGGFTLPVIIDANNKAHWNIQDREALAQELAGGGAPVEKAEKKATASPQRGDTVRVYGRDSCGMCTVMHRALEAAGVPFEKLDIENDNSFFKAMVSSGFTGGGFGLPVVVVGSKAYWNIKDHRELAQQLAGASAAGDSTAELISLLKGTFPDQILSVLGENFRKRDVNGDGELGKDEMQEFLDDLYVATGCPARPDEILRKEIVALFRSHDLNRDDKLSVAELADYLKNSHFQATVTKKKK